MRYLLGVIGVIVAIVVVIVILISSNTNTGPKPVDVSTYNYAGTSVSQTTTGALVGEDQRRAIKIIISQDSRTIEILSGYEDSVVNSESFSNTPAAYSAFLGGLQNANFSSSRKTKETNILGVCPLGNIYFYELDNGVNTIFNNWSTSCSASDGTFFGYGSLIRQMFQLQIPNYNSYVQNVNLSTTF